MLRDSEINKRKKYFTYCNFFETHNVQQPEYFKEKEKFR